MESKVEEYLGWHLPEEYLIDFEELELIEKIYEGALSDLFLAEYRGQMVAVKFFDEASIDRDKLQKEFKMLRSLRSPHIVLFYGLTVEPKLALVMEYCDKGTLEDVLANNTTQFTWKLFFQLGKALIQTLKILHSAKPPIIHRELKPATLLISEGWQLKLADFGRARFNPSGDEVMKTYSLDANLTNVAYTAPEVYMDGEFSMKTDIYSVGIVFWEIAIRIITGKAHKPYWDQVKAGKNGFQVLRMTSVKTLRPPLDGFPPSLSSLIERCWRPAAEERPSARELFSEFSELEKYWKKEKAEWPIAGDEEALADFQGKEKSSSHLSVVEVEPSAITPQEMERRLDEKIAVLDEAKKAAERARKQAIKKRKRKKKQAKKLGRFESRDTIGVPTYPLDKVSLEHQLGQGGFGEVWKAKLNGADVAVKKLFKTEMQEDVRGAFIRELSNMMPLRHPNLVQLMAVIDEPENMMIVMEYLPGGNVGDLLTGGSKQLDTPGGGSSDRDRSPRRRINRITFAQRMTIALDVVKGMNWLHNLRPQPLLHLDLKPANIILDSHLTAKIADFGLSGFKKDMNKLDTIGGSPFYMAPEVLDGRDFDEKADVYSFAMVLWFLYVQKPIERVYKNRFKTLDELTEAICIDHVRPPIRSGCSSFLRQLLEDCWHPDPTMRPSFEKILYEERLETIILHDSMHDENGVEFWSSYFLGERRVSWDKFFGCCMTFLEVPPNLIPVKRDPLYIFFRECLVKKGKDAVELVQFARFLRYFGPWEAGALDRMQQIGLHKSFHGDITKKEAEEHLRNRKKSGYYLLRYSVKPGDFIITVVRKKSRQLVFYNHTIRNIGGSFVWLQRGVGESRDERDEFSEENERKDHNTKKERKFDSIPALIKKYRRKLHIASSRKFVSPRGKASVYIPDLELHKLV